MGSSSSSIADGKDTEPYVII